MSSSTCYKTIDVIGMSVCHSCVLGTRFLSQIANSKTPPPWPRHDVSGKKYEGVESGVPHCRVVTVVVKGIAVKTRSAQVTLDLGYLE